MPFELPRDYVPVGEHTEIRALGASRPMGGGDEPRLHAWVRIRGAELAPLVQLGVLLDALCGLDGSLVASGRQTRRLLGG